MGDPLLALTVIGFGQVEPSMATTGYITRILLHDRYIHVGQSSLLTGGVEPNQAGHRVVLQRRISIGHWKTVTRRTDGDGIGCET